VKAHGSGAAALTFEGWRQAAAAWLAATKGEEETDVSQLLTNISALPTKASRIAKDLRQPIEVSVRGVHSERDVWQTVFGYMTPADEYDGRTTYARADLAQRTYCLLLDERQGDSHGYVAAVVSQGTELSCPSCGVTGRERAVKPTLAPRSPPSTPRMMGPSVLVA
jgi:hypothetical protein